MNEYIIFITEHWLLASALVVLLVGYLLLELLYKTNAKLISPQQAIDLINHKNALVLDIRAEEAYIKGHIVSAINLPKDEFKLDNNQLQKHKQKPIIVTCSTGRDAKEIVVQLQQQGFTQVLQLTGGIENWLAAGLPLTR